MADCGNRYTLSFDEGSKGWESFYTYFPDWMIGMNNKFFTFKNGDLYVHDSENVLPNTFYGVKSPSTIDVIAVGDPSEVKVFQTLSLEGSDSWTALIKAFKSNHDDFDYSTIDSVEFEKREGMWEAYIRRNEDSTSAVSKATYGIGRITNITGNILTLNGYNSQLCIGDKIADDTMLEIGTITAILNNTITLSSVSGLTVGDFIIGVKNKRIEGNNLRGYVAEISLENDSNERIELFSINTGVFKSY